MGWFPRSERGLAMGTRQTAQPLGVALAAVGLPPLARAHGVHLALLFPAGLCAVAAAAEYGKDTYTKDENGKDKGGFEKLNDVREWLGKDGHLRNLFQPSKETAPLMNTLFGYSDLKSLRWPPLRSPA